MALDKLTKVQSVGISSFIQVVGVVTATGGFVGDGSGLTGITASSATGDFSIVDKIVHTGDTNTAIRFPAADTFTVETAGSEALRITSTGQQQSHAGYAGVGINTFASWARTGGAIRAEVGYNAVTTDYMYFGTGTNHPLSLRVNNDNALYIKNDAGKNVGIGTDNPGAKTHIDSVTSNTPLVVEASQNNRSRIVFRNNVETGTECNIELFDDDLRFVTNSGERVRITSNGMVRVTDSASLTFGNNDDMRIFHDGGSANYIDVYNKDLYIRCNRDSGITGGDIILQPKSGENSAIFRDNGNVELFHDNTKRFETVSNGTQTTGRIYINGTNGGFDYNNIAHTLEFLVANGSTHSELNSNAYVPSASGTRNLGASNKRWDTLYVDKIAFGGSANTSQHSLDDYEEGTWSPNVGGNASYDIQWGYYVKAGSLVHCWGGLRTQPLGTGDARAINNLPFTAVASPGSTQTGGGSIVWHDNAPNNIINTPAIAVTPNTTNTRINAKTSGSGNLQDNVDFWQNNHRANFFITYYTTV